MFVVFSVLKKCSSKGRRDCNKGQEVSLMCSASLGWSRSACEAELCRRLSKGGLPQLSQVTNV